MVTRDVTVVTMVTVANQRHEQQKQSERSMCPLLQDVGEMALFGRGRFNCKLVRVWLWLLRMENTVNTLLNCVQVVVFLLFLVLSSCYLSSRLSSCLSPSHSWYLFGDPKVVIDHLVNIEVSLHLDNIRLVIISPRFCPLLDRWHGLLLIGGGRTVLCCFVVVRVGFLGNGTRPQVQCDVVLRQNVSCVGWDLPLGHGNGLV